HHYVPTVSLNAGRRGEQGKRRRVYVHQRCVRIFFPCVQVPADGSTFGLYQRGPRLDRDGLGGGPDLQGNIHAAHLTRIEQDASGNETAEARLIRLYAIGSRLQVGNLVVAIVVAGDLSIDVSGDVCDSDDG